MIDLSECKIRQVSPIPKYAEYNGFVVYRCYFKDSHSSRDILSLNGRDVDIKDVVYNIIGVERWAIERGLFDFNIYVVKKKVSDND